MLAIGWVGKQTHVVSFSSAHSLFTHDVQLSPGPTSFCLSFLQPRTEMFKFEVPSLMVGTLDSLMTLSDDLGKTDAIVESIVRKVEKTAAELSVKKGAELTVGGVPAPRYIQQFAWDYAKYPNRRPLKELVVLIAGGVQAIDEELKQLGQSYADKQAALQEAKRKKGGNLMVADLNDVLTAEDMSKVEVHDTEYLKTVMIAIPKAVKPQFEANVENIGKDIAGYGGESVLHYMWLVSISNAGPSAIVVSSIITLVHSPHTLSAKTQS